MEKGLLIIGFMFLAPLAICGIIVALLMLKQVGWDVPFRWFAIIGTGCVLASFAVKYFNQ